MKTFLEWLKNEGVTFFVDNAPREQNLHNLVYKLANDIAKKLPKEFKNIHSTTDAITLDGDYYSGNDPNKGTITFYYTGNWSQNDAAFDDETTEKILKAILYLAPEHNIDIKGQPKKDISNTTKKPVYRIPVSIKQDIEAPPHLDIGSANAREFLSMLNINPQNINNHSIDVRELTMKLTGVTDFHKQMTTRAPEIKANYFSGGLTEEMLTRYIDTLEKMIQWAIKHNYDTIKLS